MEIQQIRNLAEQAADLFPDAPAHGDALSWLAWCELVWATAGRLCQLGGSALLTLDCPAPAELAGPRVSAAQLLGLAVQLRAEATIDDWSVPSTGC